MKAPLFVSGLIFAAIALIHLYRLYDHFPVVIGSWNVPTWFSGVGFAIPALLALWMFWAIYQK